MRRTLLIVGLILVGGAAGFGLAYLASQKLSTTTQQLPVIINSETLPNGRNFEIPGDRRGSGAGMFGGGMMQPYLNQSPNSSATRITLDQAVAQVDSAVSSMGSDLSVAEVMEFERNFYAVVTEKSSGRGAFELLVDPYSGEVSYEIGPNMMWNLKYGHMGSTLTITQDNTLSLTEAKDLAQKALDQEVNGATVEGTGFDFYGYYTFDYQVNGTIAGMLSVNGSSGQAWFHTWHGTFISEKELSQ
jgi:hypothetical protein